MGSLFFARQKVADAIQNRLEHFIEIYLLADFPVIVSSTINRTFHIY